MESISLNDAGAARRWFAEVVEPLSDSFDAAGVDRYVELFSGVLESVGPELSAAQLAERFEHVRQVRPFAGADPDDVFVLSRVTLGADIAITSVMLDAAKRRFPRARIWFTGSKKGHELFAGDPRIGQVAAPYDRTGSLVHRIEASRSLAAVVNRPGSIVIDPDSRLTQLGLVPVCPEDRYYLFESRSLEQPGTLSELAASWAWRVFGVEGKAWMAPPPGEGADVAISLGVGENPAKRLAGSFERELIESLAATGRTVLVDKGFGAEESERVVRATTGLPGVRLFEGSFAAFAGHIAASRAYIGYDSAGQHAAAAAGVPLVTIFAGYPNQKFLERWRPSGAGPVTILNSVDMEPKDLVRAAILSVV